VHRAFKAAILFALTSFNLWGSTSKTFVEIPQVTVSLYNDAQVPSDTLRRAEQQAARIFSGAGFDVTWLRCTHNVDLGRILGSVIAHEMGHLLLGSNAHAISGIMRPHWESGELHRIAMGTLLFLPEESKRMRARIATSKAFLVSKDRPD
jgi:hypothetical protein